MDVQAIATTLTSRFIGFKGSETELLREMFAHSDPGSLRDVPSNPRSFRFALAQIAPQLLALGVSVTIFDTGMVHVKAAGAAQAEASTEAGLRSNFFSALPEAVSLRAEFGNSEQGFQRFAAYRRGQAAGRIHEPRGGRVAEENRTHAAKLDSLPIEARCRETWNTSPAVRAEFQNSFVAFLAYEKAAAAGQVRRLVRKVG